jgi:hypothetical protein
MKTLPDGWREIRIGDVKDPIGKVAKIEPPWHEKNASARYILIQNTRKAVHTAVDESDQSEVLVFCSGPVLSEQEAAKYADHFGLGSHFWWE